jgi:hypothetical protein
MSALMNDLICMFMDFPFDTGSQRNVPLFYSERNMGNDAIINAYSPEVNRRFNSSEHSARRVRGWLKLEILGIFNLDIVISD